jgi:hypothetical protein
MMTRRSSSGMKSAKFELRTVPEFKEDMNAGTLSEMAVSRRLGERMEWKGGFFAGERCPGGTLRERN